MGKSRVRDIIPHSELGSQDYSNCGRFGGKPAAVIARLSTARIERGGCRNSVKSSLAQMKERFRRISTSTYPGPRPYP